MTTWSEDTLQQAGRGDRGPRGRWETAREGHRPVGLHFADSSGTCVPRGLGWSHSGLQVENWVGALRGTHSWVPWGGWRASSCAHRAVWGCHHPASSRPPSRWVDGRIVLTPGETPGSGPLPRFLSELWGRQVVEAGERRRAFQKASCSILGRELCGVSSLRGGGPCEPPRPCPQSGGSPAEGDGSSGAPRHPGPSDQQPREPRKLAVTAVRSARSLKSPTLGKGPEPRR